jgi:hypothetical protein
MWCFVAAASLLIVFAPVADERGRAPDPARRQALVARATSPAAAPPCGPSIVADGTFEAGFPWPVWTNQYSLAFGTPLCDVPSCGTGAGTAPPYAGGNWAWFGGWPFGEEQAGLGQSLTFPHDVDLKLRFQMRIGAVTAPYTDKLIVKIDGVNVIHEFLEPVVPEPASESST